MSSLRKRSSPVPLERAVEVFQVPTGSTSGGGERTRCNGVPCGGTVIRPGAANIFPCFWEQTSAPHVSSKKRVPERFCRAGSWKAEAKCSIFKSKVKGGAGRGRGGGGLLSFLSPVPDVRTGEEKFENLGSLRVGGSSLVSAETLLCASARGDCCLNGLPFPRRPAVATAPACFVPPLLLLQQHAARSF